MKEKLPEKSGITENDKEHKKELLAPESVRVDPVASTVGPDAEDQINKTGNEETSSVKPEKQEPAISLSVVKDDNDKEPVQEEQGDAGISAVPESELPAFADSEKVTESGIEDGDGEGDKDEEKGSEDTTSGNEDSAVSAEDKTPSAESETTESETESDNETISVKDVDYSGFSPESLINRLELLLSERPVHEVKNDVEKIKVHFYKKTRREIEEKRKRFLDDGGDPVDFKPEPHPLEEKLKGLLKRYRDLKANHNRELEEEKKRNLEAKYTVIEGIKNLVNSKESINKTFQEFRELQERWRSIGIVPQQYVKDLWETYHHHVEKFYDYIKINKELRDLDLKKNMEKKIVLCEKAEQLILEPDIIQAFRRLQKYHEQWREIGPVPRENKETLWERFKAATTTINKKHQEHFQKLKETQRKNLEEKTKLAEKAEEISRAEIENHKEWEKRTKEILELQKLWKTVGFAPRKQNNAIYERFREACDAFFNRKREFYAENKEVQMNNLQLKTDLCIQAEAIQDSTEWKKTTEELIELQKKWKEIGPVPRKYSDQVWKRFRAACDTFFKNKSEFYAGREKDYTENLKLKEALIEEIGNYKSTEDTEENFRILNEFQRRWSEIGFVPIEKKTEITEAYRQAVNRLFNNLNIDEHHKNLLKYRNKLENLAGQPGSRARVKVEKDREKFINRIRQLESDITVWENNIGFFARSDNVDSVIRDVQAKIDNAKASIRLLKDKIRLIDEMDL